MARKPCNLEPYEVSLFDEAQLLTGEEDSKGTSFLSLKHLWQGSTAISQLPISTGGAENEDGVRYSVPGLHLVLSLIGGF